MKAERPKYVKLYNSVTYCISGNAVDLHLEVVWFRPLSGHLAKAKIDRDFLQFLLSDNGTVLRLGQTDFYECLPSSFHSPGTALLSVM
jgi:hypothetical protein